MILASRELLWSTSCIRPNCLTVRWAKALLWWLRLAWLRENIRRNGLSGFNDFNSLETLKSGCISSSLGRSSATKSPVFLYPGTWTGRLQWNGTQSLGHDLKSFGFLTNRFALKLRQECNEPWNNMSVTRCRNLLSSTDWKSIDESWRGQQTLEHGFHTCRIYERRICKLIFSAQVFE